MSARIYPTDLVVIGRERLEADGCSPEEVERGMAPLLAFEAMIEDNQAALLREGEPVTLQGIPAKVERLYRNRAGGIAFVGLRFTEPVTYRNTSIKRFDAVPAQLQRVGPAVDMPTHA